MNSMHRFLAILSWIQAASACLGFADRHDIFLPLNGTFALSNQIPLNAAGYGISDLGQGAYMVTEGVYQSLVVVSTEGIILVDAPPTLASSHKLEWAIGNITSSVPIRWLIYSHSHADHIGGAYLFSTNYTGPSPSPSSHQKNKVEIIAHENTASQLQTLAPPDANRPIPTLTFAKDYTLRAGNQTLHLHFPGTGHDLGNILIHAPSQGIVMLVDQVYAGWAPFSDLARSVYLPGWIAGHDEILKYDFDFYLGGHMGGPGNRTDVLRQKDYVMDLFKACKDALVGSGDPADEEIGIGGIARDVFQGNPDNSWALFAAYLDAVSERCYNVTIAKWGGRLAGLDVFGFSHARTMVNSLRLDYDVLGPNGVM